MGGRDHNERTKESNQSINQSMKTTGLRANERTDETKRKENEKVQHLREREREGPRCLACVYRKLDVRLKQLHTYRTTTNHENRMVQLNKKRIYWENGGNKDDTQHQQHDDPSFLATHSKLSTKGEPPQSAHVYRENIRNDTLRKRREEGDLRKHGAEREIDICYTTTTTGFRLKTKGLVGLSRPGSMVVCRTSVSLFVVFVNLIHAILHLLKFLWRRAGCY